MMARLIMPEFDQDSLLGIIAQVKSCFCPGALTPQQSAEYLRIYDAALSCLADAGAMA